MTMIRVIPSILWRQLPNRDRVSSGWMTVDTLPSVPSPPSALILSSARLTTRHSGFTILTSDVIKKKQWNWRPVELMHIMSGNVRGAKDTGVRRVITYASIIMSRYDCSLLAKC